MRSDKSNELGHERYWTIKGHSTQVSRELLETAYSRLRRRLGANLRNEADVEDLVQETLLLALSALDEPRTAVETRDHDSAMLHAWLGGVARRKLSEFRRHPRHQCMVSLTTNGDSQLELDGYSHNDVPDPHVPQPGEGMMLREAEQAIEVALRELIDDRDREILELTQVGETAETVAEKMGSSVRTIRLRLRRTRGVLAKAACAQGFLIHYQPE